MKNWLILLGLVCLFIASIIREPVNDTLDAVAGVTNTTYSTSIDDHAGATEDDDDDDDDEDEHEEEDE